MSTVTEHLRLLIEASAKGAASEILSVSAAAGESEQKTTLLQRAQQKLGIEGMSTGTIMKTALAGGIAVGGAALAKFATDGVDQFSSLTNQVDDLQRVMGGTAEDASRVASAIRLSGVDSKGAENAFFQLAKRIGEGKDTLTNFGAEVVKNRDGTVNMTGTLLSVADAYKQIQDPGQRAAFLMENFGRQGKAVGELLERSRDQLKSFFDEAAKNHEIFSQADLEAGKAYRISIEELSQTVEGLKVQLGSALVPTVTAGTQALTSGIQAADSATSVFGGLGKTVGIMADNVNVLGAAEQGYNAVGDLFAGHFADAGKNALGAIPGVRGFANAIFGSEDSTNKLADAQNRAKDAATNLTNAVAEHGPKSKEARDASKELADATRDLNGIERDTQSALKGVNDELTTNAQKLYDASTAAQTAAGDHLNFDNAVAGVTEKLYDYSAAQADSSTSAFDLQQKQRDLAAQVLQVQQAAEKSAVDALGPNATAQDKMNASSQAGAAALQMLYEKYPQLRGAVVGYVGDVYTVPTTRGTQMFVDAKQAYDALVEYKRAQDSIERDIYVTVHTIVEGAQDIGGAIDQAFKKSP